MPAIEKRNVSQVNNFKTTFVGKDGYTYRVEMAVGSVDDVIAIGTIASQLESDEKSGVESFGALMDRPHISFTWWRTDIAKPDR